MVLAYMLLHRGNQRYSALVSGFLAEGDYLKDGEYASLAVGLLGATTLYIVLSHCLRRLNQRGRQSIVEAIKTLGAVSQVPAFVWISSLIWSNGIQSVCYPIFSLALCGIVIIYGFCVARSDRCFVTMEEGFNYLGGYLIVLMLSAFSGFGFSMVIWRLLAVVASVGDKTHLLIAIAYAVPCLAVSLYILVRLEKKRETHWNKVLSLYAQAGLPLLFIDLIPAPVSVGVSPVRIQAMLYLLVLLLVFSGYLDIFRRLRNRHDSVSLFIWSPIAMAAILVFIKIPIMDTAGWFPSDFYHNGEYLLPWKLWSQFGQIPYWDHVPARGFDNYLSGIWATIFLSSDAPSFIFAEKITQGLYLLFVFFGLRSAVGTLPAFVSLLFYPIDDRLCWINAVCAVVLVGLFVLRNRVDRSLWPSLWFLIGTGLVLYAPGQGGLVVMSTLPIGLYWFFLAVRKHPRRTLKILAITLACTGFLFMLTPLGKMLIGAIRYGWEQAPINKIANGIPWHLGFFQAHPMNSILWEMVRSSWIFIGFCAGCIAYNDWREEKDLSRGTIAVLGFNIFLLALLYIPRAAGRIDPGSWTRLGIVSWVFLFIYFPLLFFWPRKIGSTVAGILLLSLFCGSTSYPLLQWYNLRINHWGVLTLPSIIQKPSVRLRETEKLKNAEDQGLPSLGMTAMPSEQLTELAAVKRLLDRFIRPGETYLDLTSKSAQYYIFNYPPPIECGAIYNLYSKGQQSRAVKQLKKLRPPIVYAWPALTGDGGKSSLRSHLVSRYILENYEPITDGKNVFYVDPNRLKETDTNGLGLVKTDRNELDKMVFWMSNMNRLPLAWGKSIESLENRAAIQIFSINLHQQSQVHDLEPMGKGKFAVEGKDPFLVFDLSHNYLSGNQVGLLLIDIDSNINPQPEDTIQVFWKNEIHGFDEGFSVKFNWDNSKMLVPLDSVPSWLLGGVVKELRIDFPSHGKGMYIIKNLSFWQRCD